MTLYPSPPLIGWHYSRDKSTIIQARFVANYEVETNKYSSQQSAIEAKIKGYRYLEIMSSKRILDIRIESIDRFVKIQSEKNKFFFMNKTMYLTECLYPYSLWQWYIDPLSGVVKIPPKVQFTEISENDNELHNLTSTTHDLLASKSIIIHPNAEFSANNQTQFNSLLLLVKPLLQSLVVNELTIKSQPIYSK